MPTGAGTPLGEGGRGRDAQGCGRKGGGQGDGQTPWLERKPGGRAGEPTGRAINNTYEEGENLGPLWAGEGGGHLIQQ